MAITRYSFKPVQARSQQKETLILDKELNLYRTLKNIIPCYCAVNMRVTSYPPAYFLTFAVELHQCGIFYLALT